jgi:hypothetical protein
VLAKRTPIRGSLTGLLRLDGERRESEANSKNDREPDHPHEHLGGGWLAGSLADESCPEELAARIEHGYSIT